MNPARPEHLPDFKDPPLQEVVLGVQFNAPADYRQILAGEVWNLFREDYPESQEMAPLMPTFETFGFPSMNAPPFRLLEGGIEHNRYWFMTETGDELLQFQQDRFLHNWRKVGDATNEYPRFESMITRFSDELKKLENYLASLNPQTLVINQCEVSYINHISSNSLKAAEWLNFLDFDDKEPEAFAVSFREQILDAEGSPQGRLICETKVGYRSDHTKIYVMNLTVRGTPRGTDIDSALDFLKMGRELIVARFTELTTQAAHKIWERTK